MIFRNYSQLVEGFPALDKQKQIVVQKELNSNLQGAQREAKQTKCLICGKSVQGFCNSHSVPEFCLKNISINGEVYYSNTLIGNSYLKNSKGMNNAGTFHLICTDCDNKVFLDYESPENLLKSPSSKMLAEIALKNYLKLLGKKFIEEKLYNLEKDKYGIEFEELIKANCKAKTDYRRGFDKARRLSRKNENNGYYLFYHKILDYRVPVAFQSAITLAADLKGNLVNQIYNMDQKYKPAELQIGIFPLKEKSVVMMFIDEGSKRYKNFIRQFKDLEIIEQLGVINYIMFLYTEDYFFSKELGNRIDLSCLKSVSGQSLDGFRFEDENPYPSALQECDLSKWTCIPNLLSESFSIK